MALTNTAIRRTKPGQKPFCITLNSVPTLLMTSCNTHASPLGPFLTTNGTAKKHQGLRGERWW